jgi:sugar O-acyltransferase (sialic acid O-acetyltransferase NeuD family)
VRELIDDINAAQPTFEFLGFLDDGDLDDLSRSRIRGVVLGSATGLATLDADYVVAIGAPEPRRRIDELARAHGRRAASLIHPTATVGRDVRWDEGVIVAAGSRLTTNIVVGRHSHINVNCTIGHDTFIGEYATLFSGVHLGGGVVIEDDATLGSGCVVLPYVRVGRGALVGAGAVAVHDVPPGVAVVGPAARPTLRRGDHQQD